MERQRCLSLLKCDGLWGVGWGGGRKAELGSLPAALLTQRESGCCGKLEPTRVLGCSPGVTSPNKGHRRKGPRSPPLGLGLTPPPSGARRSGAVGTALWAVCVEGGESTSS